MKSLILLLFGGLLLILACRPNEAEIVYCVKPNTNSSCHGNGCQKCETLQFYYDNVNATINRHNNVTLLFTSGTHAVCSRYFFKIKAPVLSIISVRKDDNVTVTNICECHNNHYKCGFQLASLYIRIKGLNFVNYDISSFLTVQHQVGEDFHVKNCKFHNSSLCSLFVKRTNVENSTFQEHSECYSQTTTNFASKKCTFSGKSFLKIHDTAMANLKDCLITQGSLYSITNSMVIIMGNSEFSSQTMENIEVSRAVADSYITSSNITLAGNVSFFNNTIFNGGALRLYSSSTLSIAANANVTFLNNRASARGGAIYLFYSTLNVSAGANLKFVNNSAYDKGGAIYIYPGATSIFLGMVNNVDAKTPIEVLYSCFFNFLDDNGGITSITFANNSATNGGDDIYGASMLNCPHVSSHSYSISAVTSDSLTVCLCDNNGTPQCNNVTSVSKKVYPGEGFTIPVVVTGVDLGSTVGTIYTDHLHSESSSTTRLLTSYTRTVRDPKHCTDLKYSLLSDKLTESVTIYIDIAYLNANTAKFPSQREISAICVKNRCYNFYPILYNITLLACPPGFTLLNKCCDCHLHYSLFDSCKISNGTGYFSWNSNAWTTIHKAGILYDMHCPFDYCNITGQLINLLNDSDTQCAFNRGGRLCGGCRENYSLAIGSSHCIQCPNNNNVALVIFSAAAGFILVFFITALNLTVSQGMVNGLIFYTNVVWTYQSIFFSINQEKYSILVFLRTFTAWVNLDFGIEACFINGLTAFWKTWLQFIFPFYIWAIAGLIIVASRYSTRLTNLLGNRAVPVLCSLFLLSYVKLLRLVVTALEFSILTFYPDNNLTKTHSLVWSVDGNLSYFGFPHILLFVAGLVTLLNLCLPYTLLLLFVQLIRRLPH